MDTAGVTMFGTRLSRQIEVQVLVKEPIGSELLTDSVNSPVIPLLFFLHSSLASSSLNAFERRSAVTDQQQWLMGKRKVFFVLPICQRFCPPGPAYASASSHCSPASQRVFRTRYKMVTRPGSSAAHQTLHYNPALSWRAKRIQSASSDLSLWVKTPDPTSLSVPDILMGFSYQTAVDTFLCPGEERRVVTAGISQMTVCFFAALCFHRSFLQSRLRSPHHHDRHPASTQHWRGSGMCWIGGSLYRVSANKLSRTAASNVSVGRTGRFSGPHTSPVSPAWSRHSSTRHLASRAVQRSLAIIRHAHQKKQQKQYCMYYNRFGKCNRGNSCPFIHDPDKVAVCTRFLRGTCKRADGTCPFSHKVAKEKMPVCSYFLRGICNNSDCPYSHVYVSRKAEVCQDFVRGYCPEGEKCKKKHTLVCPDFSKSGSCPRGTRCKLQHRQQHAKRGASGAPTPTPTSTSTTAPAKRARTSKRPCLSVVMPDAPQAAAGTPAPGPLALPSFISLSSSPEEPDAPDTLPAEASQRGSCRSNLGCEVTGAAAAAEVNDFRFLSCSKSTRDGEKTEGEKSSSRREETRGKVNCDSSSCVCEVEQHEKRLNLFKAHLQR
ncbi:hypothetical protein F2P81_005210 [Scophthalmus maximus]|uniref:Zinc finger CCCH domain-containing protein 3 n=1 Tax=Scophthalmus maximus TaxID=52904 RepID=A0A6A4TB79_SCOMX|nr:hypothetical protein F2P81_005210 [Scophthalmus maximus]